MFLCFFFFHDPPPTEIYTLSLHDALPILGARLLRQWLLQPLCDPGLIRERQDAIGVLVAVPETRSRLRAALRSEEHTSELQSPYDLVCRLLLEKKKKKNNNADSQTRSIRA